MKLKAVQFDPEKGLLDQQVNMSNALTRAGHGLSLSEKRIVAACIANSDQIPAPRPGQCFKVRVTAGDYAEAYGVDLNTAYEQLKGAAQHLFQRQISIEKQTPRGKVVHRMRWVGAFKYHDGEGWAELDFWHEVVPHLFGLRGKVTPFTKYKLSQAAALRSIYSFRLFELLQSWRDKGLYAPTIEEFVRAMEPPPSCIKDFGNLRMRVIEPAVAELIDKNNLLIEWKPVKAGRKVIGLEFRFKENPQGRLL